MKPILTRFCIPAFSLMLCLGLGACQKDNFENSGTLRQLYKTYKNGEISQCQLQGEKVYEAGLNAYDAGTVIYDERGNQLGVCNAAWGNVDSICQELTGCEVIYRIKNNIWGEPSVDKYGLGE